MEVPLWSTVGPMGQESLGRALTAVMVAGGVVGVDLHDQRDAHRALRALWESREGRAACEHLAITVTTVPDPDVGLRVGGLTQALWSAVKKRYLEPVGDSSFLAVSDPARAMARSLLSGLLEQERVAMTAAGQDWACRSTARNAFANSFAFRAGM